MRVCLAILALACVLPAPVAAQEDHASGSARGASRAEPTEDGFVYRVASGDTLSDIAVRFGVTVDDLVRWNAGLSPDRIRSGQPIRVDNGRRRVAHAVQSGESLSHIALRYEVRVEDILGWNAGLDRDRVRVGRELVIYTPVPESRSLSIGAPQAGRLENGRPLPVRHPAFFVRTPSRAYGTDETVRWIVEAFDAVRRAEPDAPRLEVHDLSFRRGGPIRGHNSHESGRDADLAYYQRQCADRLCRFRRIGPDDLDVERTWRLLHHWLVNDRVEVIFIDHDLQRALHAHARQTGVSARDLSRWFQYPRAPENRYGVIRHHPRHADHMHVRFVCPESDPDCR